MKNVTTTSKPLLLVSTLLAFVFSFSACSDNNPILREKENNIFKIPNESSYAGYDLRLIEIDSCQYLFGEWGNATVLTHKGNCSHCRLIK